MMAWIKVIFDGFELVPTYWFHHWFQHWFHPQRFLTDIFLSSRSWELKFLLGVGDIGGYVPLKWRPSGCIIKGTTAIWNPEGNHAIFALIIYSRLLIYACDITIGLFAAHSGYQPHKYSVPMVSLTKSPVIWAWNEMCERLVVSFR